MPLGEDYAQSLVSFAFHPTFSLEERAFHHIRALGLVSAMHIDTNLEIHARASTEANPKALVSTKQPLVAEYVKSVLRVLGLFVARFAF